MLETYFPRSINNVEVDKLNEIFETCLTPNSQHCVPNVLATIVADYNLGRVIGRGGFGQDISTTRKTDNLPLSTENEQLLASTAAGACDNNI